VQHRKEQGAFHIESELPTGKQIVKNRWPAKFPPKLFKYQHRPDSHCLGGNISLAGKHKQGLLRAPGKRPAGRFDLPLACTPDLRFFYSFSQLAAFTL